MSGSGCKSHDDSANGGCKPENENGQIRILFTKCEYSMDDAGVLRRSEVLKVVEYRCCCHIIIHAFVLVYAVPRATQLFPSSRLFLTMLFK